MLQHTSLKMLSNLLKALKSPNAYQECCFHLILHVKLPNFKYRLYTSSSNCTLINLDFHNSGNSTPTCTSPQAPGHIPWTHLEICDIDIHSILQVTIKWFCKIGALRQRWALISFKKCSVDFSNGFTRSTLNIFLEELNHVYWDSFSSVEREGEMDYRIEANGVARCCT